MLHRNRLRSVWNRVGSGGIHLAPRQWQTWLRDTGSLTRKLEAAFESRIEVLVLADHLQTIHSDESRFFHSRTKRCRVREVLLLIDQQPIVIARSIIPTLTASGSNHAVLKLGKKPLGAVLFQGRNRNRLKAHREITQLDRRHPLWKDCHRRYPEMPTGSWARRTLYHLKGHPLLVNEVFLTQPPAKSSPR
ncbi:MAG: chorismate--pyruvate lyase family protein [Polynucleobacter sp.]